MNQQAVTPGGPQGWSSTMKWLLIVLVIVIVLGGGYLVWTKYGGGTSTATASPSPATTITSSPSVAISPTASANVPADWKTYTNTKYNYSVKYPTDWQVLEYSVDKTIMAKPTSERIRLIKDNMSYVEIFKDSSTSISASINYWKSTLTTPQQSESKLGNETATKISGTKNETVPGSGEGVIYYILENNANIMVIQVSTEMNYLSLKGTIDQILSTFQFTS